MKCEICEEMPSSAYGLALVTPAWHDQRVVFGGYPPKMAVDVGK